MTITGCASRAPFNQYSYNETVRLKTESTDLILRGYRSYALVTSTAELLQADVLSAYHDARIRTKNDACAKAYLTILDKDQESLAGALQRWKANDTLSLQERKTYNTRIAQSFDLISSLENKKQR
jgi:hypothetical protein